MNKTVFISGLFVLALITCSQALEQTFNKIIWVKQGIKFGDNTIQTSAATGTGTITWDAITDKPTFSTVAITGNYLSLLNIPTAFPPIVHTHDYAEITNKPSTVELVDAISTAPYLIIPKLTTAQIGALTPQAGMFIYDITLNVLKIYNGTEWKILITNQ